MSTHVQNLLEGLFDSLNNGVSELSPLIFDLFQYLNEISESELGKYTYYSKTLIYREPQYTV